MESNMTILLVEDDEVDVMTIQRAFAKNNITNRCNVVSNGEEALDYLRNQGIYGDTVLYPRPGIILMDLNMPRMSGFELLYLMKNDVELRDIPVVVLTASDDETDIKSSYERGAAGYIVKPVTFDKYLETVAVIAQYWKHGRLPRSEE